MYCNIRNCCEGENVKNSLKRIPLRVEKIDTLEFVIGVILVLVSLLMPLVFNMHNFPVRRYLFEALRWSEKTYLMTAALILVALNALRGIPHYVGAFFIGESIDFMWHGKKTELLNAALTVALLRAVYRLIYLIYGVRYDFGIPAMLTACFGVLFQILNYKYISHTKKALLVGAFLTAFQFLDVMPLMDSLPVGRGETSQDIKIAAAVLDGEGLINTVGMVGILPFFLFGVLIFFQLRVENNLRELNVLREQNEEIRTRAQINEMKNRTYQEMQYLVHDLKSPLTALQTLVGVLKMKCEAEERSQDVEYLTRVEDNVEQMSRMISEILYEDQRSPITTKELVRIVLAQVSTSDYASYIRVQNDVPQTLVSVNHVLFPRALVNLLQNSARAVRGRAKKRILLRVTAENGTVSFSVADNGIGISPDRQTSVWEHGVSSEGSSGMGLAFVRGIVDRLGGETRLCSKPNEGTCITITISEETMK